MDWGEGSVVAVSQASDEGSSCDACLTTFYEGVVLDVGLRPYDEDARAPRIFSVCESCFDELTSDMGIPPSPGEHFLVLIDADAMLDR